MYQFIQTFKIKGLIFLLKPKMNFENIFKNAVPTTVNTLLYAFTKYGPGVTIFVLPQFFLFGQLSVIFFLNICLCINPCHLPGQVPVSSRHYSFCIASLCKLVPHLRWFLLFFAHLLASLCESVFCS